MSTVDNKQLAVLMIIPFGLLLLYLIDRNEEPTATTGKEQYYLTYNKDEIMKNLLASEGHFRNIADDGSTVEAGFLSCVVKHLADAEGHGDEAISHSAVVEGQEASDKFRDLRNDLRELRYKVQKDSISPHEGILEIRKLRREFESFNPEYDVSTCESCTIQTIITDENTKKVQTFNP